MLLELQNIKKFFPSERGLVKAVDDVSLSVNQGENLGIVGESGSGKTTLSKIILKILKADSGKIIFDGEDVTAARQGCLLGFRKNVQMVFQDPYSSLDPRFTIRDILLEPLTLECGNEKQKRKNEIEPVVKSVRLPADILNRYPHEFSGGERQRIAIARALMINPRLLVLDEAVSSLDVIIQKEILDLLLNLQKEFHLTYLFVSHNLKVVRKVCSKVAVMYQGKIVEYALTEKLFKDPAHPYTKELLKASLE